MSRLVNPKTVAVTLMAVLLFVFGSGAEAGDAKLKPFILGNTIAGDMNQVVSSVKDALKAQGFQLVGTYSPYGGATVICVTSGELKSAAGRATNGGFGAAQRVAVTQVDGQLQVSYANPEYVGTAYGMGKLDAVSAKLKAALGAQKAYGAQGLTASKLRPGNYRYMPLMETFKDVVKLQEFSDHKTAVDTIERNLSAKKGGTRKVYRIDLPGKSVSVFGVAINRGDGGSGGRKDTDREIMNVIDYRNPRSTAYLPYEVLVTGGKAIMLHARYRIAVHFPDTTMIGVHGFANIMSAPDGVETAMKAITAK